jgi:hypothetical protein
VRQHLRKKSRRSSKQCAPLNCIASPTDPVPTALFAQYFPKVFGHHRAAMRKLQARHSFAPPFNNSAYSTGTVNCGPRTVCRPHYDRMNYPSGPCAITALGPNFDAKEGGHLIIFSLAIYIPFPAGSTVLISSACFLHGNAPIQSNEQRCSFTQFIPGPLMQWIGRGCQLTKSMSGESAEEHDLRSGEGLEAQLGRLSKVDELIEDRKALWAQESACLGV